MAGAVPERGGGGPDFLVVCWRHPKITVASRNSQVDRHDQAFVWDSAAETARRCGSRPGLLL